VDRVAITIIGGGVVGCAVARELAASGAGDILVVERNARVLGDNQSSRNSGVIHAGIYYDRATQPLKARLCVEGNRLLYDFCREFGVPHRRTGKLVVAVEDGEAPYLDEVKSDAQANGVPDVRELEGPQVRALEPNVRAARALHVPTTGLVEPTELVAELYRQAKERGVLFLTGNRATAVSPSEGYLEVTTRSREGSETFATGLLINAAGLYSDEVARMVNPDSPYRIRPIRGEWARFNKGRRPELDVGERSIYPAPYGVDNATGERARVPYPEYRRLLAMGRVTKTIGIHLSPTFDLAGNEYAIGRTVIIGPTYVVGVGKEDYAPTLPAAYYLDKVQPFFPGLRVEDLELHSTGIRAKPEGLTDYVIECDPRHTNCLNLIGIDSPGLTAALAIARYVRDMLRD
jgi:L-2-hydroxyglutarate oxidase LhgO